jgi:hypothetical protein
MNTRKSITLINDDVAYTFIKPFSQEHGKSLFVIFEDAYGDAVFSIMKKNEIIEQLEIPEEKYEEIIKSI